jgi:hypothetical protein
MHKEIKRDHSINFSTQSTHNSWRNNSHTWRLCSIPQSGPFLLMVIAMRETADFFQEQIKQCNRLAARTSNKTDREFWPRLAHRWEELLQARQRGTLNVEVRQI